MRTNLQSTKWTMCVLATALVAACGAEADPERAAGEEASLASTHMAVVTEFGYAVQEPEGVAPGFDIDGRTSVDGDPGGCGQADFTSPGGDVGVDNALAHFIPLLEAFSEGATAGLIQGSINEGGLLVMMEWEQDELGVPQALTVRRGAGAPLLGTDARLLSGQSFDLYEDDPLLGVTDNVTLDDRVLLAGPMALRLPIVVFGLLYVFDMTNAWVRFRIDDDGSMLDGVLGGSITIDNIMELVTVASSRVGDDLVTLFGPAIRNFADLELDAEGVCHSMSVALVFRGSPAFLYSE